MSVLFGGVWVWGRAKPQGNRAGYSTVIRINEQAIINTIQPAKMDMKNMPHISLPILEEWTL